MEQVRTNWLQKAAFTLGSILLACGLAFAITPVKAWAEVIGHPTTIIQGVKVTESFDSTITLKGSIVMSDGSVKYYGDSANGVSTHYTVDLSSPDGQAKLKSEMDKFDEFFAQASEITSHGDHTYVWYENRNIVELNTERPVRFLKLDDLVAFYLQLGNASETLSVTKYEVYTVEQKAVQNAPAGPKPEIIELTKGDGSSWTKGAASGLEFTSNQAFDMLAGVSVDGKLLEPSDYDAVSGSTVVTLKPAYLAALSEGSHDLSINTWKVKDDPTGGFIEAHGTFTIKAAATTNPDPISIDTVKITGATLSFKAGDAPKFTAKSSEPGMYYSYVEEWDEVGSDRYITSSAFFNRDKNKLISKFEAGKSYTYSVWVKPYSVYAANGDFLYYKTTLSNVKKLSLNGKTITLAASQKGDLGADVGIWLYKVASFKIAPAAAPAPVVRNPVVRNPVVRNPVVKDESGLSGNQLEDRKDLFVLLTKGTPKSKTSVKLSWSKFTGATGYEVYQSFCDGKRNFKKVKEVSSSQALKHTVSKLKKNRAYKFFVAAYKTNGKAKTYLSKSPTIHVAMSFDKKTNAKSISVKKAKVALKVKGTHKIQASMKLQNPKKKVLAHAAKLRYCSDNKEVATVNKSGKVVAKKKGSCNIYVTANNGVYKKVKVTVKG